jgi:glycosyltransferase involved in cell wall biosynthesis
LTRPLPDLLTDSASEPIKVLIVAPALPLVGGQTIQAARLLREFRNEAGLVADFQPINPKFLPKLQQIKYVRTVVTTLRYIAELFRNVPKADVVHIFSASYFSFLLAPAPALVIAKLFRKRTILNYRSGQARDHLTRWKFTAVPTVKAFDKVITPSGYLVDVFAEFGIEAESISNFVDLERFRFRERKPLRPVFISNRNFEPLYNVSCLLRAFKLIQGQIPEASLIVVGDGSERESLQSLSVELQLRNVEFTGPVRPEEMPSYYDKADVYLNSPSIDNMPNSIIEAFACGLPVVSTNAGGIPYIVANGETGLLVNVGNHKALASAAIRLFNENGLSAKLTGNARSEVERYSWTRVRRDWLRVYQQLAGRTLECRHEQFP